MGISSLIMGISERKPFQHGNAQTVDKLDQNRVCLFLCLYLYNVNVDFHFRHSLSAGGRGASSASPAGLP